VRIDRDTVGWLRAVEWQIHLRQKHYGGQVGKMEDDMTNEVEAKAPEKTGAVQKLRQSDAEFPHWAIVVCK